MDEESQQPIILDCGKARRNLLITDLMPSRNPTRDHNIFLQDFRQILKHPRREALNIPQLPLESEFHDQILPIIYHKGDPESEDELEPGRRARAARVWNTRGRGRGFRARNMVDSKEYFRKYSLVSMSMGDDKIFFLYDRVNSYLVAARDLKCSWWEFSVEGGKLFSSVKGLGFNESYQYMGPPAIVGRYQFETAFRVFCNPEKYTVDNRKEAAQIIIALTSESARIITLYEEFKDTLTDVNGELTVKLDGDVRVLMTNWSKASLHIIDNCGETEKIQEIEKIFSANDKGLIEVLKKKGMKKVEDASIVYGLLLGKVN